MITFQNPTLIPLSAITTMGINAKDSENPIGYFGTGLKYAIAVLLREKQEITIHIGTASYTFSTKEEEIRGKTFHIITMSHPDGAVQPLGFTTELGKNWPIEHAYRELYCNCMDESGVVLEECTTPAEDSTTIVVTGTAFHDTHQRRDAFILNPKRIPLTTLLHGAIEVYLGSSNTIFYRGISAHKTSKETYFTYNFKTSMNLTEDRTFQYTWMVNELLQKGLALETDKEIVQALMRARNVHENSLDFTGTHPSEVFLEELRDIYKSDPIGLPDNLKNAYQKWNKDKQVSFEEIPLSNIQTSYLQEAAYILRGRINFSKYPVKLANDLGRNVLAMAKTEPSGEKVIWLTPKSFESTAMLLSCLIEEYVHHYYGVADETREMQDVLINLLIDNIQPGLQKPAVPHMNIGVDTVDLPF